MNGEKIKEWFKKYWVWVLVGVGAVVMIVYARLKSNSTSNSGNGEILMPTSGQPQSSGGATAGSGASDTQTTDTLASLASSMQSGFQSLANALQTQQQTEQQALQQMQQSEQQAFQQLQQNNQQSLQSLQDAISKMQNNQQTTGALATLQNEMQQLQGQLQSLQAMQSTGYRDTSGGFSNPVPVNFNTGGYGQGYGASFTTPVGTGEVVGSPQTLANWASGGSQMYGNTAASFSTPASNWTPQQTAALSSIENAHDMSNDEKLAALKNAGLIS